MHQSVWICPTRTRPANVERLIRAWQATEATSTLVVAVDDDDPSANEYWNVVTGIEAEPVAEHTENRHGFPIKWHYGPRLRLGPTLNMLAVAYATDATHVGFLGDDHIPRTAMWDMRLADAITAQRGGLAYGNDLLQGPYLATAVLQDARIVERLGYFCPPTQTHLYLDNYWMDLGRGLGKLAYLGDVVIEHAHYIVDKAPSDALYLEVNSPDMYSADERAYLEYKATRLDGAIKALRVMYEQAS